MVNKYVLEGGYKDVTDNVKTNISEKKGKCQIFCSLDAREQAVSQ